MHSCFVICSLGQYFLKPVSTDEMQSKNSQTSFFHFQYAERNNKARKNQDEQRRTAIQRSGHEGTSVCR